MVDSKVRDRPVIGITLDIDEEYLRLKHQYPSAIIRAGGIPLLIPNAMEPYSVAGIIDGLLIPGGKDIDPSYYSEIPHRSVKMVSRERTDFEMDMLKAVMEHKKPVFGICYGMQLINVALGGHLYQDIGSQLNGALDHRSGNHGIRIISNSRFPVHDSQCIVNSSHHQAVRKLGEGLDAFAFSDDDVVEAFYLKDYPFLLAVQWHPERSNDELSLKLLRAFVEKAHVG